MHHIEIKNLTFSYDKPPMDREVISDISWSAAGNESVGIIGANGAGKSTLLKLLVGLQVNYSGSIHIHGLPVRKENLTQIRKTAGFVFQDSESQLFMPSVYEDVAFAPRNYGFTEAEVERKTMEALNAVHIEELKDRQVYRLSGGQKKLASIATILSVKPEIILMDEPSIALDPKNRRNLIHVLNELPVLKVIASHDLDFIMDTCARTILISKGRIIKDGNTDEILMDNELLENNGLELPLSFSRGRN